MPGYVRVSGTHRQKRTYLKVAGVWKPVAVWLKVLGFWVLIETGAQVFFSAGFDDITGDTGVPAEGNTATASVFDGPANIIMTRSETGGLLYYSKNGGSFTNIASGGTISMATGDTLRFRFVAAGDTTDTVTLTDADGFVIDSFDLTGIGI